MKVFNRVSPFYLGVFSVIIGIYSTPSFAEGCKLPSGEAFYEMSLADKASQEMINFGGNKTRQMTREEKKSFQIRF